MAGRVSGKVALVTGAARGQGRAEAVMLAAEGADIIAIDVCGDLPDVNYPLGTLEDMAETVRLVEAQDRRIVSAAADVRDRAAMTRAIEQGLAELGRLDVIVANAGITMAATWDQVSPEMWDAHISICLTGVWNTLQLAAPHIVAGGRGGSIVITSSAAGLKGYPFLSPYVAAKHGLVGLMRVYANELAPHSIRVNTVHPTGVETGIGGEPISVLFELLEANPKAGALYINALPVETLQPDDIAQAVLFLASDESKYITGVALPVDAGNFLI
jgi:SDR family mycofactocin-dependent oxidoreductase